MQLKSRGPSMHGLEASVQFYHEGLGRAPMPRPAFGFPGAWLHIGDSQELHLLIRPATDPGGYTVPRERHWAIQVADIAVATTRLRKNQSRSISRDVALMVLYRSFFAARMGT